MDEALALYRSFGFATSTSYAGREFESIRAVDDISVFMALDLSKYATRASPYGNVP
jgi:hypothetical protein